MTRDFLMKASARNNDVIGTNAADLRDGLIWKDFLLKIGFKYKDYYPFHYGFALVDKPKEKEQRRGYFTIYAVRKDTVGENLEQIKEYLEAKNNKLPVTKFNKLMNIEEFFDLFKRYTLNITFFRINNDYFGDTIEMEEIKEIEI